MTCKVCCSPSVQEFSSEIMVHFQGRRRLQNPGVLVFPIISVCLDCGLAELTIPVRELGLLREELAQPVVAYRQSECFSAAELRTDKAVSLQNGLNGREKLCVRSLLPNVSVG